MKTYYISVSPKTGIGIGFIAVGENENHALAELSLSLRQRIKIKTAHIIGLASSQSVSIWEADIERHLEVLRTIRKPGRYCLDKTNFYSKHSWKKVTVKEVTRSITAAYVEEVWLDRNL